MDVSAILILPFSAIVAFATLIWAAKAERPAPRLIWPCAVSTLPEPSEVGLWLFALCALAVPAAIGTIIGGVTARAMLRRA